MRAPFTVAALALAAYSVQADAQTDHAAPHLSGHLRGSIGATLGEAMRVRCVSDPQYDNELACDGIGDHLAQALDDIAWDAEQFCSYNGRYVATEPIGILINCIEEVGNTFFDWLDGVEPFYPRQNPHRDDYPFLNEWCANAVMRIAPNGLGIEVTPIPLVPGGPMDLGVDTHWTHNNSLGGFSTRADNPLGAALYDIHIVNTFHANPENPYGPWKITTSPDPAESLVVHVTTKLYEYEPGKYRVASFPDGGIDPIHQIDFQGASGGQPCPADGGGVDTHFYVRPGAHKDDPCIWYVPNFSANPTGYNIAPYVYIPFTKVDNWLNKETADLIDCPIAAGRIAELVQRYWERAHDQDPTNIPPPPTNPVTPQEVIWCEGRSPSIASLVDDGTESAADYTDCPGQTPADDTPTDPTDNPTEDPPPTDADGDGVPDDWYNPPPEGSGLGWPSIEFEMPDFFPDLPAFNLTGTCPVYALDLQPMFQEQFQVESHCPLIEDFRATISAVMIAAFSIMAIGIVMRA